MSTKTKKAKLSNVISVTGQCKFGELLTAALLYAKILTILSLFVSSVFGFPVPAQIH